MIEHQLINIGIIGTGNCANNHINSFKSLPSARIISIYGRNFDKARKMAKQHSIKNVCQSLTEMLEDRDIDAVVIAVPPYLQKDIAVSAFQNAKHVLCEKMLAVTLEEVDQIRAECKRSAKIGMVNFCYRLIPEIQQFKKLLEVEKICGDLQLINAEWILSNRLNPDLTYHWKGQAELGGGVLQNFGIHILDYLLYNKKAKLIGASQKTLFKIRNDDYGQSCKITGDEISSLLIESDDNTIVTINLSLVSHPQFGHRVIARGNKGTLELRNLYPNSYAGPFSIWLFNETINQVKCLTPDRVEKSNNLENLFVRTAREFINAIRQNNLNSILSIEETYPVHKLLLSVRNQV